MQILLMVSLIGFILYTYVKNLITPANKLKLYKSADPLHDLYTFGQNMKLDLKVNQADYDKYGVLDFEQLINDKTLKLANGSKIMENKGC